MKIKVGLFFCLLGTIHVNANALGLGEIHVTSGLNEPFAATIDLNGATGATEEELLIRLASEEDFKQMGVSRETVLLQLKFEAKMKGTNPVISVTSDRPIREPFLDFVLDLQSPKAQMLKEYTVFLNPVK